MRKLKRKGSKVKLRVAEDTSFKEAMSFKKEVDKQKRVMEVQLQK